MVVILLQCTQYLRPKLSHTLFMSLPSLLYSSMDSFGQQCCYNAAGSLVIGQPGGGSGDKMSPVVNYNQHVLTDLLPYVYCCKSGLKCDLYYEQRPSGSEEEYSFPFPGTHGVMQDGCTSLQTFSTV